MNNDDTTTTTADLLDCESCGEEIDGEGHDRLLAAQTFDCPADWVTVCDDCQAADESAQEAWAEAQAEDRANGWR